MPRGKKKPDPFGGVPFGRQGKFVPSEGGGFTREHSIHMLRGDNPDTKFAERKNKLPGAVAKKNTTGKRSVYDPTSGTDKYGYGKRK